MDKNVTQLEASLRTALFEEAERLDVPTTLWPRVAAQLARPPVQQSVQLSASQDLLDLLRQGNLRAAIITVLTNTEMDGLRLTRLLEGIACQAQGEVPTVGKVLPLLHQLEQEHILTARWYSAPQGLRRMYTFPVSGTLQGKRSSLGAWLSRLRKRLSHSAVQHIQTEQQGAGQ